MIPLGKKISMPLGRNNKKKTIEIPKEANPLWWHRSQKVFSYTDEPIPWGVKKENNLMGHREKKARDTVFLPPHILAFVHVEKIKHKKK